jgi:regulator of replication initiation timing
MAKTATRGAEIESLDRLEDKIKRLVAMVEKMKSEQMRAADENQRLRSEIDALKARAASGDSLSSELASMKEERDVIRTRVSDMLHQLEALNL